MLPRCNMIPRYVFGLWLMTVGGSACQSSAACLESTTGAASSVMLSSRNNVAAAAGVHTLNGKQVAAAARAWIVPLRYKL